MILSTSKSANGVSHFHLLVFFIAESGETVNQINSSQSNKTDTPHDLAHGFMALV